MNTGFKLFALAVTCLFFASARWAFAETGANEKPKTKLEAFQQQTGSVLIKGYTEIGNVVAIDPSPASTSVHAMEFASATTKNKLTGIVIEINTMSRRGMNVTGSERSFIDYDEIDDLLKGIDYISNAAKGVTKHDNFEVKYSTRGDFSATTFNSGNGEIKASIDVGRLSSHLPMDKFSEFRSFIVKAKAKIESTK